jgi:membrane-bound lytic murein transglycosylase B
VLYTTMNRVMFLLLISLGSVSLNASDYAERKEVMDFAKTFAETNNKKADDILRILEKGKKQQSILDAIARPAEKKLTWGEYRKIFIEPQRIDKGVIFWREHRQIIDEVSKKYQVAPEIIVAIIGVETRYGRITGSFKVLDALLTLGFDYEPRAPFFRGQLEQFLLMCDEQKLDPSVLMGSYAGAMGYGQFIPSSYRNFAVDHDQDGIADIWTNPADAIASVANYFTKHGWQYGEMVAWQLTDSVTDQAMVSTALKPALTIKALRDAKVKVPSQLHDDTKVTLMKHITPNGDEYWLGFENFYTITRYNHSSMYALAVFQLSELLKARLDVQ